MKLINRILVTIYRKKLTRATQESTELMQRYKDENVFKSATMRELLSDVFEYKGSKPNTVLIKDKKTGAPVEATVKFYSGWDKYERALKEKFILFNDKGRRIGAKDYYLEKDKDGTLRMLPGEMFNFRKKLFGIGFRLDQLHIERALQLGFDSVPRESLARATLYHTKMGFLPVEDNLIQIFSLKQAKKVFKNWLENNYKKIPTGEQIPIIVEEGGAFFVDLNKTKAHFNLQKSKEIIEQTKSHDLTDQLSGSSKLKLEGEQLEHWREIIKEHPVLSKMNFKLPEY